MENNKDDEYFMRLAIEEAKNAPFPFGCLLVKNNHIIAKGRSGETENYDPTAHAEVNAIRQACKGLNTKDLNRITLYSTCEPCPMCFSAAWWANINKIVFGISLNESSKIFGKEILVSTKYLNENSENKIHIKGGVLKEEILKIIKNSKTPPPQPSATHL